MYKPFFEFNSNSNYDIYVDLDGVLVDLKKSYEVLSGEKFKSWKDLNWDLIQSNDRFWYYALPMTDYMVLWNYIQGYKPTILSSPGTKDANAIPGKRHWVKTNLGLDVPVILTQTERKGEYASSNRILIDDREKSHVRWKANNGISILHISATNTIKELQKLGL